MAANVLATQRAGPSETMLLTKLNRNNSFPASQRNVIIKDKRIGCGFLNIDVSTGCGLVKLQL